MGRGEPRRLTPGDVGVGKLSLPDGEGAASLPAAGQKEALSRIKRPQALMEMDHTGLALRLLFFLFPRSASVHPAEGERGKERECREGARGKERVQREREGEKEGMRER